MTLRRNSSEREIELDRLEGSLAAEAGFLAASAYWADGPSPERVEERRRDLRETCAAYVETFDRSAG